MKKLYYVLWYTKQQNKIQGLKKGPRSWNLPLSLLGEQREMWSTSFWHDLGILGPDHTSMRDLDPTEIKKINIENKGQIIQFMVTHIHNTWERLNFCPWWKKFLILHCLTHLTGHTKQCKFEASCRPDYIVKHHLLPKTLNIWQIITFIKFTIVFLLILFNFQLHKYSEGKKLKQSFQNVQMKVPKVQH